MVPDNYLTTADENVTDFVRLYIDQNVYALTPTNAVKHSGGRPQSFELATPPDDGDLRPGHKYRLIDGTGVPGHAAACTCTTRSGTASWCS